MYKRTLFAYLAFVFILLFADIASATITQPKFTIIPTIPVRNILTTVAQYRVTNKTKITRSLTMVAIQGVSQITGGINSCGTVFTLATGESCLLTLSSTTTISDTPVQVCKTNYNNNDPDPFLCSQTSAANNLNLAPLNDDLARLVSLPNQLTLTAGSGTQGTITVSNLSSVNAATNVQAVLTGTALDGNVIQDASRCTALPALGQCNITFTPGSQAVSLTAFPIQGDNTTQAAGAIIIVDANTAKISVSSGNPLVLDEGGSGTLTIKNNSNVAATNVAADLSELQDPTALTQNSSSCSTLAANGTCQLQFVANNVLSPETMFISGTNTSLTASGVAVNESNQIQLQITSGSPLQLQADGSTTGTMTILNSSTTEIAEDVQADFTNTGLSGKVTATSCGSINPQTTCDITYTPSIYTAVPTNFIIAGSNTAAVTGNLSINSYKAVIIANSGSIGSSLVDICDISQSTGELSNCSEMTGLPNLSNLAGVAFNLAANHVYFISSFDPTVTDCNFNPDSTSLSSCKNTTVTSASGQANGNGIVYHPVLGTIFVTVSGTNSSSTNSRVYQCSLNSSNQVSSCSDTGADNITYPTGISLNSTGEIAYIGNFTSSNSMVNCDVSLSDGSFTGCNQNTGIGDSKNGVAVNPDGTYVYAAQQLSNNLVWCVIDPSDNSISSCTTASIVGSAPLNPFGIALNPVTSYLYVNVASKSEVQLCPIDSNDEIGSCSVNPSISNLEFNTGIALFPTQPQ